MLARAAAVGRSAADRESPHLWPGRAVPTPAGRARFGPAMNQQVILLEDGWNKLKTGGVQKIEEILEDMQGGVYKTRISTDEYSHLYTCAARARGTRMRRGSTPCRPAPLAPRSPSARTPRARPRP